MNALPDPGRGPDSDQRARLDAAFHRVDRAGFLPADQRGFTGEDAALPIGHGQTNSQPSTVRAMLELLDVRPGQRVLDVGCGSGWTTALLGDLVGPTGVVVGVEIVPALTERSRANLRGHQMPWTRIEQARPGVLGVPGLDPYDRVLVSAGATRVPPALVDQFADAGVMVVPVRGRMTVVRRTGDRLELSRTGWYSFVPLVEP